MEFDSTDKLTSRPRIEWLTKPERDLTCPVCGARGPKPYVLSAAPTWSEIADLDLHACPACESKFFPDFEVRQYRDFPVVDPYLKFYLEIGAGIDLLVRPFFSAPLPPGAHYLEVGCGFGFALDFGRRMLGLNVLGIDPGPFAIKGAPLLGVPMIFDYLTPNTDLGDRRFDLAVASEVLEHIPKAINFIQLLARHLTPEGVLIVTTPRAASAIPQHSSGVLIPLLSAGWHCILYSENSLRTLLHTAGFTRVEVVARDHTLLAVATNSDRAIVIDAVADRKVLRDYFEQGRHGSGQQQQWLADGFGYRLMKDLTNDSQYIAALEVFDSLRKRFNEYYGFDIDASHEQWLQHDPSEEFATFAMRYPLCICGVAYFRGVIALNYEDRKDAARHYFSLSVRFGEMMRTALQEIGQDDSETEVLTSRGRILYLRALVEIAPDEAASTALSMLQDHRIRLQPLAGEHQELASFFSFLINTGELAAAETLASECESLLNQSPVFRHGLDSKAIKINFQQSLARLELNHRKRPYRAALNFALAERAYRSAFGRSDLSPDVDRRIGELRHDRFIALIVAGDARRARVAGRYFERIARQEPKRFREFLRQTFSDGTIAQLKFFANLANLGLLAAAGQLSDYVAGLLSNRSFRDELPVAVSLSELFYGLGLVEINLRNNARKAAHHFALAERAYRSAFGRSDRRPDIDRRIGELRHDRFIALIVAGDVRRARVAGRSFERMARQEPERFREFLRQTFSDDAIAQLKFFANLANLGLLAAAGQLSDYVAGLLSNRSFREELPVAISLSELFYGLGLVEINLRNNARKAAHHFALAERAYRSGFGRSDLSPDVDRRIGELRHDRFIALIVAGDVRRARVAGLYFERMARQEPGRFREFLRQTDDTVAQLKFFANLANLGLLAAAGQLSDYVAGLLSNRSFQEELPVAISLSELFYGLGLVEINLRNNARKAAHHFALAERAARRGQNVKLMALRSTQFWQSRQARLLAWVVAGNAKRAVLAGRIFQTTGIEEFVPPGIQKNAIGLMAQAMDSSGSV